MRQHHPASLPFYSVCINGANRNYQTLHYSLKPSCGNCHLTTLQQGSERLLQASRALLEAPCAKHHCGALLRARPRDTPMSHCVVAVLQPCRMETHTPQRTKETSSQRFPEWGHIITHTRHTLVCCPCALSARAPWALSDPRQRAIKSFWSIH